MGRWIGWLACVAIVVAAAIPTVHRVVLSRRASPLSRPIRFHAAIGVLAALFAFVHVGSSVVALGDPRLVRAGNIAIFPGLIATFLLVAHVGVGLRLLSPRLQARVKFRRIHGLVATVILVAAFAHVAVLLAAR